LVSGPYKRSECGDTKLGAEQQLEWLRNQAYDSPQKRDWNLDSFSKAGALPGKSRQAILP